MSDDVQFRPLNKRIVVRRFEPKEVTKGGIILPEIAKEESIGGEVIAVGDESPVKVGEKVAFTKYAGTVIAIEGKQLLLLKEEDLLGVFLTN